jgi:hypothetical protein
MISRGRREYNGAYMHVHVVFFFVLFFGFFLVFLFVFGFLFNFGNKVKMCKRRNLLVFELGKLTDTNGCTMERNTKLKQGSNSN